jgi:LruC domain-containing protein
VAAADWALSVQAGDGSWPEEHGYWPTTASTLETTARFTFGLAQAIRRVDSARAAQYQASLERAVGYLSSRGLSASGSLGGFYTFQLAYALLAYRNAGAANNDPNVVALRNYLLARFNTGDGSGWGYGDGVGSNHYDTGIALYALCQAGERLTNASISAAATYLNNTQTDQGNGRGYWASPYFGSVDIPTIFAVLRLSCFGSVGVHTQAVGPSRQQIDAQDDATQTRTFTVRVSNTGNFATQDTFNIGVLGGLPGFSVALSANVLTIGAGEEQDVTVQVGVPARVAFGSEATYSIVATSRTNGSANSSTTLTLFTSEPPAAGQATQTWFFGNLGPGLTVTSVSQPVRLGVTVVNPQATPLQGPNIGVVTFFVGGFAVGSDGDANGDGLFELDWVPGADWNRLGQQDLRAIYSGIDQPGPGIDYLSSFTSGATITVNTDDDGDGIPNDIETGVVGTNPTLADTDGDGCGDGLEHFTMRSNPRVADTDGDGFGDCSERNVGTDPLQAGSFPDVDHDGVSDIADLFPCDPLRSAAVFSPGEGEYGTLMFEDNWPVRGDLDFNDAVLAYNSTLYLGSNGGVTGLRLTIVPRAIGAKERSGLAIRLPTSITALRSATRSVAGGAPSSISAVADGERDVVVNISTDLREFWGGADGFINTAANGFNPGNGQQVVVELLFAAPVAINLAQDPFDLFFYRTGDFSHQVHRPQYSGTAAMNTALFNSGNDGSSATRHFVDTAGLPYVLSVPSLVSWPYEQMRIEVQFPGIVGFASSGGTEGADYYLRPSGFGAVSASSQIAGVPGVVSDLSCRPTDRADGATCQAILAANPAAPSGVYTIDPDGRGTGVAPFAVYCDQVTDGGGWMQVAYVAGVVSTAHNLSMGDVAVRGRPLHTFTTDATNRPVAPDGLPNTATQLLFRGGNGTWRSTMGEWVRMSTYPAGTTTFSNIYQGVLTGNGRTAAYHCSRGWAQSNGFTTASPDSELCFWDADGVSGICGGGNVPGGKNCPQFSQTHAGYPWHYDAASSPREVYLR